MIRLTITVPLSSLPGVEVEASYEDYHYNKPFVDLDGVELSLVFETEVPPDFDYEDSTGGERTAPASYLDLAKMRKPRLLIEQKMVDR